MAAFNDNTANTTHFQSDIMVGTRTDNAIYIQGAATTVAPIMSAVGNDTNISWKLIGKGTGGVQVGSSGTATATAGAATLNADSGKITSEALTTAAGAVYTLTLTNSHVAAADIVNAKVCYGTCTTGSPAITRITEASGSVVILVQNVHASAAFNGTIVVGFTVEKQGL